MKRLLPLFLLLVIAAIARGEKSPRSYDQLPIQFPPQVERMEKSLRDERRSPIHVRFKFKGVLPSCVLLFRWKSTRYDGELEVEGEISAPSSRLTDAEIRREKVKAKGPLVVVGSSRAATQKMKALPTADWTTVRVPIELGERGLTSLDGTYTVSLRITSPEYRVLIDEMRLEPL